VLLEVDIWVKGRAAGMAVPITIGGASAARPVTVTWYNPEEHARLMGDKRYCFLAIQSLGIRKDKPRQRTSWHHKLWRHQSGTAMKKGQVLRYPEAVWADYQVSLYAHRPRYARYLYSQLVDAYPVFKKSNLAIDIYGDGDTEDVPVRALRGDEIREIHPLEAERHTEMVFDLSVKTFIFHRSPALQNTFWKRLDLVFTDQTRSERFSTSETISIVL